MCVSRPAKYACMIEVAAVDFALPHAWRQGVIVRMMRGLIRPKRVLPDCFFNICRAWPKVNLVTWPLYNKHFFA